MMATGVETKARPTVGWKQKIFDFLWTRLDIICENNTMDSLGDISKVLFEERPTLMGHLMNELIEKKFSHLLHQKQCDCPHCGKSMQRSKESRMIETLVGTCELTRPYFYCRGCHFGWYPLDDALKLSESKKQYDVQDIEAWLASEMPYEIASETYERITGQQASAHHMHDTVNKIAENLNIVDVCPSKEEVDEMIETASKDKFRKPILMLAADGAHAPTRPEPTPHPRKGHRGEGEWREVKGFRLYLLHDQNIIHIASWHQICDDRGLANALMTIKEIGLIPEEKVRLGIVADGAAWIWNRCREIFPSAKEILDYYHCAEYVHEVAATHFGKDTREAVSWYEATLTRIYFGHADNVLIGLSHMKGRTDIDQEKIDRFRTYLRNHCHQMNYDSLKRGGYHIGSGAIESANKFIGHTRLKRSGAWWYVKNANNILKIRCAKYNGTYDRIIEKYNDDDLRRIQSKKKNISQ